MGVVRPGTCGQICHRDQGQLQKGPGQFSQCSIGPETDAARSHGRTCVLESLKELGRVGESLKESGRVLDEFRRV